MKESEKKVYVKYSFHRLSKSVQMKVVATDPNSREQSLEAIMTLLSETMWSTELNRYLDKEEAMAYFFALMLEDRVGEVQAFASDFRKQLIANMKTQLKGK